MDGLHKVSIGPTNLGQQWFWICSCNTGSEIDGHLTTREAAEAEAAEHLEQVSD